MNYQVIFTDELYHHGLKGQRWGIRRYRNEDGSLTDAGKRRYNNDSDKLALLAGSKFRGLGKLNELKPKVAKEIGRDPKNFQNSQIRLEYLKAINETEKAFNDTAKFEEILKTKYKDIKYNFAEEKDTGEQYVTAILKTKTGDTYVSEYYLGYKVED